MTRQRDIPTIEQVRHVVQSMPTATDIQRRNRALVAFTALTGMRDSAVTSLRLQHVDTVQGLVKQEPDKVKTKFSKKIEAKLPLRALNLNLPPFHRNLDVLGERNAFPSNS